MKLNQISIRNFKNHEFTQWQIQHRINVIHGNNGSGKTNLLDTSMIMWAKDFYRIEGIFETNKINERIVVKFDSKNKRIERDDIVVKSIVEHVGRFPCTVIAPQDIMLVTGLSDMRRKFIDQTICQTDSKYLSDLIQYNQLLKQRNAYLKQANRDFNSMTLILDSLDQRLVVFGEAIYKKRSLFFEKFIPEFDKIQKYLSKENDEIALNYVSVLSDGSFREILKNNRKRDFYLQRSSVGVHKDDFKLTLNDTLLHRSGSQGQLKTVVFALKMAQYRYLTNVIGKFPILLLDDVFDKLDPNRISYLMELLNDPMNYGQIFITDTSSHRLQSILSGVNEQEFLFAQIEEIKSFIS
jgi:DNA replication and repair protein RecF